MPEVPAALATALADRYRLERKLGEGGMATVFLAQDLRHDRQVANQDEVVPPLIVVENWLEEVRQKLRSP